MKIAARLLSLLVLFAVLTLSTSCGIFHTNDATEPSESETNESVSTETDIEKIKSTFTYEYNVDDNTSVELTIEYENGYADKIKVSSAGDKTSVIDLTEASMKVLATPCGVEFDGVENIVRTADINLDGHEDLLLRAWKDNDYTPFYVFLWNDDGTFDYCRVLGNPYVDVMTRKVYSTVYSDGTEAVYVYNISESGLEPAGNWSVREPGEFITDTSAYEESISPFDTDEYIILVNDDNKLDAEYVPDDLLYLPDTREDGRAVQQMRYDAAKAVEALFYEMRASGYNDMSITSAYRSYHYQETLFNSYVTNEMNGGLEYDEAVKAVSRYSAEAGTSEHQTGLCCDMHNLPGADQSFANEEVYTWLRENAWKFGFVLRFPEDKEEITNITFEPWHYRFVGRYHADKMTALGMCLEEYVLYISDKIV